MTTYSMTPIQNGTRLRTDHNVFAAVIDVDPIAANIQSFNSGDVLVGDDLWEAPADGSEVKKGDKWVHVTHRNGVALKTVGWTAYIHKALPVCNNFKEVTVTPPPVDPAPVVLFPQSAVWEYVEPSTGKTVRLNYVFDKQIA